MFKSNWFRKKAKGKKASASASADEVLRGIKGVLEIASQEEIRINLWVHNAPKEKTEAYAKQIDRLFKIRGTSHSGDTGAWIEWVVDKLSVYLFTKE